jgi:hypothetical protein
MFVMTQSTNSSARRMQSDSLPKQMVVGAVIAFILMFVFLLGIPGNPAWGRFWKVRPFVVISFAGAAGGVFYYLLSPLRRRGGWRKVAAVSLSLTVYIIGLWLGAVLGLDGTLWD